MHDQLLRVMFESTSIGVAVADAEGRWLRGNPAFLRMLGRTAQQMEGERFLDFTHADDRDGNRRLYSQLVSGQRDSYVIEKRFLTGSGGVVWVRVTASLTADRKLSVAMVEDITALRSERLARERLTYDLGERLKELTCVHGAARVLADASRPTAELLAGLAALLPPAFQFPAHTTGLVRVGALVRTTPTFRDSPQQLVSNFTTSWGAAGEVLVSYHEAPVRPGEPTFLVEEQALLDSLAEMLRVELERRHAEALRIESTERLELALKTAEMGITEWDVRNDRSYATESFCAFIGLKGPLVGPGGFLSHYIHPDDRAGLYGHMRELTVTPHLPVRDLEYRLARPEGGWRTVHVHPIVTRDAAGLVTHVAAMITDITVRRGLEESLRTAQKLDALGLVTGSVAHDFNNVLAAMLSGAQLLMMDVPEGAARAAAKRVYDAALRGAGLTRQMLAFSRKTEFLMTPLDLAALVQRNKPILERVCGDSVKLETSSEGDCAAVANAGQVDQLLLILAMNAREAISGSGTVTITTRMRELSAEETAHQPEARPGKVVELAVRDTGHGMPHEVLARAFEPFFTTRQSRNASGLGLALAHTIARQHEGHITIESEPGKGTVVRVFLRYDPL